MAKEIIYSFDNDLIAGIILPYRSAYTYELETSQTTL